MLWRDYRFSQARLFKEKEKSFDAFTQRHLPPHERIYMKRSETTLRTHHLAWTANLQTSVSSYHLVDLYEDT